MQHGYRGNASSGLKKWTCEDTLLFILPLPTIRDSTAISFLFAATLVECLVCR
ncbi:hypothetical protein NEOLEDRAFT_1135499 [Neolentinus lepideus HHB14362 ss-1]|uniref:Uncharacterized protein n=1 Tax=Neolentinus lepideus HHB14362 ss-1 TaxID=1314782 RepID=A0A165RLU0_9AGAM|nr:hypothetical protein NEOLEDRAFT_1135499 [Neolentinus lepideus HHB14362 ss-1]